MYLFEGCLTGGICWFFQSIQTNKQTKQKIMALGLSSIIQVCGNFHQMFLKFKIDRGSFSYLYFKQVIMYKVTKVRSTF